MQAIDYERGQAEFTKEDGGELVLMISSITRSFLVSHSYFGLGAVIGDSFNPNVWQFEAVRKDEQGKNVRLGLFHYETEAGWAFDEYLVSQNLPRANFKTLEEMQVSEAFPRPFMFPICLLWYTKPKR